MEFGEPASCKLSIISGCEERDGGLCEHKNTNTMILIL